MDVVVGRGEVRRLRQGETPDSYARATASAGSRALAGVGPIACVGCGGTIADVLMRLGSTRCHDCRDGVQAEAAPRDRARASSRSEKLAGLGRRRLLSAWVAQTRFARSTVRLWAGLDTSDR
jgi:hypothetical protein